MLVMGVPQFSVQDDSGSGCGILPIPQWQLASADPNFEENTLEYTSIDPEIRDVLSRLRIIFRQSETSRLKVWELHDLTCFVLHKVLLLPLCTCANLKLRSVSECVRYAIPLYMLGIHGITYYSHAALASAIIIQLKEHLQTSQLIHLHGPLGIWVLSVCIVATASTPDHQWFVEHAYTAAVSLSLRAWEDILSLMKSVLWMEGQEEMFRQQWDGILKTIPR